MNLPFIVAEMSANHLGSLDRAREIIEVAADMGADAIKLQTFNPDQMCAADKIIETGPWAGRNAVDLYREAQTPREWHQQLFEWGKENGLVVFSSPFHRDDVDFLETLDCPIYKIASFEVTDTSLISHAAFTGKPLIISTGMATREEIREAIAAANDCPIGTPTPVLLKCTSAYPADATEANLATMVDMNKLWGVDIGLSDHTPGHAVAVAATALGAIVIEKHLTLSRKDGGPDAGFSMEPYEFQQMVKACREAAAAIGTVQYGPTPGEAASMLLRRKPGGKRGD
jgi:pseudaminic acid synthase